MIGMDDVSNEYDESTECK